MRGLKSDVVFFFAVLFFIWLVSVSGCSCQMTAYNRQEQAGCPCPVEQPAKEPAK
jgi:hypothetical protein